MDHYIQVLQDTGLFNTLHKDEFLRLAEKIQPVTYPPGEWIIREGEIGRELFIILEGAVQVIGQTLEGEVVLAKLTDGAFFGEQALLHPGQTERNASIRSFTHTKLLKITKSDFQQVLSTSQSLKALLVHEGRKQLRDRMRKQSELFRSLKVTDQLKWQKTLHFSPGQTIFKKGQPGKYFYLIGLGAVKLYKEKNGKPEFLASLNKGQCFGELALIENRKRSATAVAESNVELLAIEKAQFAELYNHSPELRDYLQTLQKAYNIANQGFVTQHSGQFMGYESTTNLFHLEDGRVAISSFVKGQNLFNMHFVDDDDDEALDTEYTYIRYEDPTKDIDREIILSDSRIVGMTIQGPWTELGRVQRKMLNSSRISEREVERFQREGALLDLMRTTFANNEILCHCLQVSRGDLRELIRDGVNTTAGLAMKTGAGTVCGSCHIQLEALLGRADWTTVEIREEIPLTEDIKTFRLYPTKGKLKPFLPGQHIVVQARINGHWVQRPYTLTSVYDNTEYREITVKAIENGYFSKWLFETRKQPIYQDTLIQVSQPQGNFYTELHAPNPIVFFAGGIGVTPTIAMARAFNEKHGHPPLYIDYSISSPEQNAFADELQAIAEKNNNINVNLRITAFDGRLQPKEIKKVTREYPGAMFYACGPERYQKMVETSLKKARVKQERIHVEAFEKVSTAPLAAASNTSKSYIWLGLALLMGFLVQSFAGLEWSWLASMQSGESYQRWSGLFLMTFILVQWILPALRLAKRYQEAAQFYPAHKYLGALSPLVFYVHSIKFGYAFLGFLSITYFLNTFLGLFNKELLTTSSNTTLKEGFTFFWLITHIVLSLMTLLLMLVHIFLVFGYQ